MLEIGHLFLIFSKCCFRIFIHMFSILYFFLVFLDFSFFTFFIVFYFFILTSSIFQGANGILGLARKFRIMDDDESGTLDITEFGKAMRECSICDLSKKGIDHLFHYFDTDNSGTYIR